MNRRPNGRARKNTWNEGAKTLGETRRDGETVEAFANRLGIERTICGRFLSGDREPGMLLRKRFRDDLRIPLDAWDQKIPHPDKTAKPAA